MTLADDLPDARIDALLELIFERYQYDFRRYARASLKRRVARAMEELSVGSLDELEERVRDDAKAFGELLGFLTVRVTEMFRDPAFWAALRTKVVPYLATYPSLRVWSAGIGTGEEAYSLAILLAETGLLDRTTVYATDIDPTSLAHAEAGVFSLEQMQRYGETYLAAGGTGSLSDHYTAAYGNAVLEPRLRKSIVFSDHSLATDSVFAEVQLVLCRNVFIYFERSLQEHALGLFADALCRGGFLGLGSKEIVQPSFIPKPFVPFDRDHRIYRRVS